MKTSMTGPNVAAKIIIYAFYVYLVNIVGATWISISKGFAVCNSDK